ncbi:unnamed protein product [Gordionus sp. m RMFG-2023]
MSKKSAQLKADIENIRIATVNSQRDTDDKFTNLNHKEDNMISKMNEFLVKLDAVKMEAKTTMEPNLLNILTKTDVPAIVPPVIDLTIESTEFLLTE